MLTPEAAAWQELGTHTEADRHVLLLWHDPGPGSQPNATQSKLRH